MRRALLWLLLIVCSAPSVSFGDEGFEAGSSVEETMARIRELPADDSWWTVNGAAMRWNHLNLARFVPTVDVPRQGAVRELENAPNPAIGDFPVDTPAGSMSFDAFLASDESTTMAVLILHRGKIVFERYPRQRPLDKPLYWSVTKVLVSTMVGILEHRGLVDVARPVDDYLPRLAGTAYGGVPVRDVLDMASGVDCGDEDYADRDSCYSRYSASIGESFRPPGSPDNPYDFLASLSPGQRWAPPGSAYRYSGVDTFVLGWLVEELTGLPFHEAFTRDIWRHLGAEADARFWAGRYGIPLTSGGFMATVRDLGRFGLLFTPSRDVVADRPIVPEGLVDHLLHGGRPSLLEQRRGGDARAPGPRHRVYQWNSVFANDDLYKGGWAGQGLLVNPGKDLVAVWTGYYDEDGEVVDVLPMLRAIWASLYPGKTP